MTERDNDMSIVEANNTTTTAEIDVRRLRLDSIDADPNNRHASVDKDMVASVRAHGVIEPILVRPNAEQSGRYQIVAGERRYRASILAELDSIDAIVRELDDQAAVELQIIENLHRRDLKATEEAAAMFRLVDMGMTQRELAKRIGKSAKYVGNRLRLLELPKAARKQLDSGQLTVEEAIALCGLVEHPEHLAAILAEESDDRDVEGGVRAAQREIERAAVLSERTTALEAEGQRVVAYDANRQERNYLEIGRWMGLAIDVEAHRSESCHAVVVNPYRPNEVIDVCTDGDRHQSKGDSTLKTQSRSQGARQKSEEEKAQNRARTDADAHRRAFLGEVLQGKFGRAEALTFVMTSFLDGANAQSCAAACKLLGLDGDSSSPWEQKTALISYASESARNLLRAALSVAAAQGDGEVRNGFSPSRKASLYAWMGTEGYEPTEYEAEKLVDNKPSENVLESDDADSDGEG